MVVGGLASGIELNLQHELDKNLPLGSKLGLMHEAIKCAFPAVHRVAVARYDAGSDTLSTFLHSSGGDSPLVRYSAKLADVGSLREVARLGLPRVLNNLSQLSSGRGEHTRKLLGHGYRSSLTYPFYRNGRLQGFIFYNSVFENVFGGKVLLMLNLCSQAIASLINKETTFVRTVTAAIRTAQNIGSHKDAETGAHLARMGHYCRLIATEMAEARGFDDEFIEYMHLFAPLHDIGKIAIPDRILLKPAQLTREEFDAIKGHPQVGRRIIDDMVDEFDFAGFPHIGMLRNIVEFHHESMDGSGYPYGLEGKNIPVEARICAVADIFDALSSRRPYKPAWSNETAFSLLTDLGGSKVDAACVQALICNVAKVVEIQGLFAEEGGVRP